MSSMFTESFQGRRLLVFATKMTDDKQRADFLLRTEPLKAFDGKTAKTLLKEGRVEDVIAYLESFEGGAAG